MSGTPVSPAARRINPPHLQFGGMSQGILHDDTLHISGQVGLGPDGELADETDMYAQAAQALTNLGTVLDLADLGPSDVVKYTCYVTDLADFGAFAKARSEFFGDHEPAATTVVVAALLDPRMLVEIEAVAVRTHGDVR